MKIYLIVGKSGSGKDSLGKYLQEEFNRINQSACLVKLTSPLYEYARNYFGWDGNLDNKPRKFLQEMGVDVIKEKLHKDFFLVNRLCEDIDILKNYFEVFIITDGRLQEEIVELRKRYSNLITIKIERSNYSNKLTEQERSHITENDLDNYHDYDYEIINVSNDDLQRQALNIVNKSKEAL